jgi:hypothetical protein
MINTTNFQYIFDENYFKNFSEDLGNVIKNFFNQESNSNHKYFINLANTVKIDKIRKNKDFIKFCKNKTGLYFFTNEKNEIVYIGVNAKENTNYCLFKRLSQHFSIENNASFINNIVNIDKIDKIAAAHKVERFKLSILILGEKQNNNDNKKAKVLETLLIYLTNPKYNKI